MKVWYACAEIYWRVMSDSDSRCNLGTVTGKERFSGDITTELQAHTRGTRPRLKSIYDVWSCSQVDTKEEPCTLTLYVNLFLPFTAIHCFQTRDCSVASIFLHTRLPSTLLSPVLSSKFEVFFHCLLPAVAAWRRYNTWFTKFSSVSIGGSVFSTASVQVSRLLTTDWCVL